MTSPSLPLMIIILKAVMENMSFIYRQKVLDLFTREGVNLLYPNRELLPQQGGLIAKAGPVYKISCLVERFGFMSKVHLCTYLGA